MSMSTEQYADLQVDDIIAFANSAGFGGVRVQWTSNAGFGEMTLMMHQENGIKIDHEAMGKEFCIALMTKVVEKYYKQ